MVKQLVIPAPISIGINSSRACPALDAGNPGFFYRFPVFTGTSLDSRSRFHGNDRKVEPIEASIQKATVLQKHKL